jgi:arginyl-tRNA synthetase
MRDYLGIDTESRYEHMSGRKGLYINVDPFMDLLRQAALEESRDRNPDAEKEWLDETSEKVALASLRYALLTTDTNKIVVFDVDRALDVTEESGSYVLYGYARACGILERGEESPAVDDFDSSLVATPEESTLVKAISKLPMIIERSARDLDSAPLGRYAFTLTTIFNKFYEKCPVTTAENPELLISRLTLVASYAQTMRNVCGVLGLPLVARM